MFLVTDFKNEKVKARQWSLFVYAKGQSWLILSSQQVKNFAGDLKEGEGLHVILRREKAWDKQEDLENLISGIQDF